MSTEVQRQFQRREYRDALLASSRRLRQVHHAYKKVPRRYRDRMATIIERSEELARDVMSWQITSDERYRARVRSAGGCS